MSIVNSLSEPQIWANLFTLTILEIVLGVDNLIFIAIASSRLPVHQQPLARRIGLLLAMVSRLALLMCIAWLASLTQPVLTVLGQVFSGRDLVFVIGGLFLIYKAAQEIRDSIFHRAQSHQHRSQPLFLVVVIQIMIFDIVFSLDSVITAVGLSQHLWVMATAIIIAIIVMLIASEPLSRFIERYPSVKILALCFLVLVGFVLVADGFGQHIPRAYLYFSICFSIFVESMNILAARDNNNS